MQGSMGAKETRSQSAPLYEPGRISPTDHSLARAASCGRGTGGADPQPSAG